MVHRSALRPGARAARAGAVAVTVLSTLIASTATAQVPEALHTFANIDGKPVPSFESNGRVTRLYGTSLASGTSAQASVDAFLTGDLSDLGVNGTDFVPALQDGPGIPHGRARMGHSQPVMYQRDTGTYRFTAFYYEQVRDGVPVYGSRLTLLVRNEPGYPLVLANTDVRNIGDFRVPAADQQPLAAQSELVSFARFQQVSEVGDEQPRITYTRRVIFAGIGDDFDQPRLADVAIVRNEVDEWLFVTDAATGEIIHEEHRICFAGGGVTGNVSGLASEGVATAECEDEVSTPLPYLHVTAGAITTDTDANGDFTINGIFGPITVSATLNGVWFEIFDAQAAIAEESAPGNPPSIVDLLFNSANNDEFIRAQVNAYVESNRVRDTAIGANPAYPTLMNQDFPATVNRTDGFCPSNAWYDPGEESINFCASNGSSNPNTAWSSVVHHEYGHHLVNAGGSGQGQYGEGMGDVMSTIILDSNRLGAGWAGNCSGELRNADNDIQYPCTGAIHFCGQLISGCVWETRNELISTEPAAYTQILADLAVNAILVHSGSSITPAITIDWLTLDDDDSDIFNGTPHYDEIATGFGEHNMDAPALALLGFEFPDGLPTELDPDGGDIVRMNVSGITGTPVENTGRLFVDTGSGPVEIVMTQTAPNEYEGAFPAAECATFVQYHFAAEAQGEGTEQFPYDGSDLNALSGFGVIGLFDDDFESDLGWSVTSNVSDGAWERAVPAGGGDRGDPPTDADGSGQCYVTDNADGNSDVDGGTTTLTSPIMDASGGNTIISYYRWYSNTAGDSPMADIFEVEISDDGGASWMELETVGPGGPEVDGDWFLKQFDLDEVAGFEPNDQFRIRFSASDLGAGSVVEAGVDGVTLSQIDCDDPGVFGDLDGDGIVAFSDLLVLLAGWGDCVGCPADLDGNGVVDFSDLLALLAAWTL